MDSMKILHFNKEGKESGEECKLFDFLEVMN